jgi:hypothetical protein
VVSHSGQQRVISTVPFVCVDRAVVSRMVTAWFSVNVSLTTPVRLHRRARIATTLERRPADLDPSRLDARITSQNRPFGFRLAGVRRDRLVLGGGAAFGAPARQAADVDWNAVQDALGRSGRMMPGDVFRVGMARTDLKVTVNGVAVMPASRSARTPPSSNSTTARW